MNFLIFFKKIRDAVLEILNIKLDRSFGMDISDRSIEILELKLGFRLSVATYSRCDLESGIVENGRIIDKEKLVLKIKEALLAVQPKKISTDRVVLSLPESKTFIHYFNVDSSFKKEQLRMEVFKEALKIIPFDPKEVYWDFLARPSLMDGKQTILYISALQSAVLEYAAVCQEVGLELTALDVESISLARAILKENRRSSLIVDMGARTTAISLFDPNNLLALSATTPIAGDYFTECIKSELKMEKGEAEIVKEQWGMQEDPRNPIFSCLGKPLTALAEEIKKAIIFYEKKVNDKIEKAYLAGGSALLPGIGAYLQKELRITVAVANPVADIKLTHLLNQKMNPIFFANVIGLAMKGVSNKYKSINLLTQLPSAQRKSSAHFNLFAAGYLKKTTVIRHFLNNPLFVISFAILSFAALGFVIYFYLYVPFYVASYNPLHLHINQPSLTESPAAAADQPAQLIMPATEIDRPSKSTEKRIIIIKKSPTGWVNIRSGPGSQFQRVTQVYPGEYYELLQEEGEWYKIKLNDTSDGWIINQYAEINK